MREDSSQHYNYDYKTGYSFNAQVRRKNINSVSQGLNFDLPNSGLDHRISRPKSRASILPLDQDATPFTILRRCVRLDPHRHQTRRSDQTRRFFAGSAAHTETGTRRSDSTVLL
ncbi:hypothetical protein ElyMa_000887500 [Elysia marginata]|uniref:Uncharacterized protein n=1 Tax=Elysia marginata TaxID=1093978 RepID=A0AAV4H704_9GAST|nr:hypothetical protein ElyMa_000887500 [Elysia marginata]